MIEKYEKFLTDFDTKLKSFFERDFSMIKCKKGCSLCCTNGNYPLSQLEMSYLMRAFAKLGKEQNEKVKTNIKTLLNKQNLSTYTCPFLLNGECSVYSHRPIICRVHGLAFRRENGVVNLPGCSDFQLNYSEYYDGKMASFEPISEDLTLSKIIAREKGIKFGVIRTMLDWFRS